MVLTDIVNLDVTSSAALQHCVLTLGSPSSGGLGPPPYHSATTAERKYMMNNLGGEVQVSSEHCSLSQCPPFPMLLI